MCLSDIDWSDVLLCDDPDEAWFKFKVKFNETLDTFAPYKKMKIRGKLPDWMNHDFIALTELRDDRKRVFNKTRTEADGDAYRILRNSVATLSKNLKKEFVRTQIEQCQGNCKKLWRFLSSLIPGRKSAKSEASEING